MQRGFAFRVVCRLLGLVILLAGIAKGYEALDATGGAQTISWLQFAAGAGEAAFGLWVILTYLSRLTWWLLLGCFTAFLSVSFYQAVSGQSSCGCFGRYHLHPWVTFSFDFTMVIVLWCYRSIEPVLARPHRRLGLTVASGVVPPVFVLGGMLFSVAIFRDVPTTLSSEGEILGTSRIVLVDTREWVGRDWPLLPNLDIRTRLSARSWIVVLFRRDCASCQREIPEFLTAASLADRNLGGVKTILVEVPKESATSLRMTDILPKPDGTLRSDVRWVVHTPLFLKLREGVVLWVTDSADNALQFTGLDRTDL